MSTSSASLVGQGCRICKLHLCREVRPLPMSALDMTLNYLIVRLQSWSFGECGVLLPDLASNNQEGLIYHKTQPNIDINISQIGVMQVIDCQYISSFQFEIIRKYIYIYIYITQVGDLCRGWSEGSLFNSYYTEV